MDVVSTAVFVLAILWVLSQLVVTRRKLRTGQVVIPPLFAATPVFLVCILVVAAIGASPLHLLWLFLLSFVLGLALVLFPPGLKLSLACLGLLYGLSSLDEPQPPPGAGWVPQHGGTEGTAVNQKRRLARKTWHRPVL